MASDPSGLDELGEHAAGGDGCRNATREPRMPVRGVSSIRRTPCVAQRGERRLDVGDLVGDVVQARARAWRGTCRPACRRPAAPAARRGSRRRRAARPRRPARRWSRDARAACRRSRSCRASAASRSATATPMWSMPPNIEARECTPAAPRCDSRWSPTALRAAGSTRAARRRRCAGTARTWAVRLRDGRARAPAGERARAARRRRRRRDGRPGGRARRAARTSRSP